MIWLGCSRGVAGVPHSRIIPSYGRSLELSSSFDKSICCPRCHASWFHSATDNWVPLINPDEPIKPAVFSRLALDRLVDSLRFHAFTAGRRIATLRPSYAP